MRCPRCPNGAVVAANADAATGDTATANAPASLLAARPTGPHVDLSLTMNQMPSELRCRVCSWRRDAGGMSHGAAEFADRSTEFTLLPLGDVPLHPGLEASGRNDDVIQRLMKMPRGVLCTVCGGPSPRVDEEVVKGALASFKNLPQPPSDIESRESWWGFQSANFVGRPVILEWYFVVTRAIEGNNAQSDDMVDLCLGCGRCCFAKHLAPRVVDVSKANKTAPLSGEWADRQRQRDAEARARDPANRRRLERDPETGLPVYPAVGDDDGDDERAGDNNINNRDISPVAPDASPITDNRMASNNLINSAHGMAVRRLGGGAVGGGPAPGAPQPHPLSHDHSVGAVIVGSAPHHAGDGDSTVDTPPVAVIADPEAVKEATVARLSSLQQVRVLEEARRHIVTLLESVMGGPPSVWPRFADKVAAKPEYAELWQLASLIWVLASSSPTRSGAVLEWSLARDFLVRECFRTQAARRALDGLFPRDPRDPDLLVWSEKWVGVHTRCGALIFARRLHECVPLAVSPALLAALRDAVSVANRTRALRLQMARTSAAAPATRLPQQLLPSNCDAAAATAQSHQMAPPQTAFADSRVVRFPIGWITPHAWKSMQARAFRFAMFVLRQAELDGKTGGGAVVYLVAVKLMLRFMTDATALCEGSFFSLLCGLPYSDDEARDFVAIDFRDPALAPQVRLAVDRLLRISRGANWEAPNPNWAKSLIFVQSAQPFSRAAQALVAKMANPSTIAVLKVVACHEDVAAFAAAA